MAARIFPAVFSAAESPYVLAGDVRLDSESTLTIHAGVRVLLDDRAGVSPGVGFKDAELIGVPTIAIVGRGLADDANPTIEVKDRRSGDRVDVPLAEATAHLSEPCRS